MKAKISLFKSSAATLCVFLSVATLEASEPQVVSAGATARLEAASLFEGFALDCDTQSTPEYQWQFNGINIPDATNSALLLENIQTSQSGAYRVVHSTPCGANISPAANLTVRQGTRVRFQTAAGEVQALLFDFDKPETVRNFLRYVRSGAYRNMFFHRVVPGFVAQGGGFNTATPGSADTFLIYDHVPNFGAIINEFAVGSRVSNTYGTIAMAKVGGDPDSASSQWFFNLADNSENLDSQNGGFTAFGRIVAGTNVLEHFNSLSLFNGIADLTQFYGMDASVFSDLPVRYSGLRPPNFNELFYVGVSMLSNLQRPAVAITFPPAKARLTSGVFNLQGTASDDVMVASVFYRLGTNAPVLASGAGNWSAPLDLPPGNYTVQAQSEDSAGNVSAPAARPFTVLAAVQLNRDGTGAIVPNLTHLQPGKAQTFKAVPGPGQLFAGWSGDVHSPNSSIRIMVQSNLNLTATFASNHFPKVSGIYNGLFSETTGVTRQSAGFFTIKVTPKNGTFSGRLLLAGAAIPIRGQFNPYGQAGISIPRRGATPVHLSLSLDLTNGTEQVTGTVSHGSWTAAVLADRAVWTPATGAPPAAGKHTIIFPGNLSDASQPDGDGYAALSVNARGLVMASGWLADNTRLAVRGTMSKDGRWPFYASFYRGGGVMIGWVGFAEGQPATVEWIRAASLPQPFYSNGFQATVEALLSRYEPPEPGEVYDVELIGGGVFAEPVATTVTVNQFRRFIRTGNDLQLQISLNTANGLVTGSFVHPGAPRRAFRAAYFKDDHLAAGYFINTPFTGRLRITRQGTNVSGGLVAETGF